MEIHQIEETKKGQPPTIERLARAIVRYKMESPAIFLLETHKPLTQLGHAAGIALSPLLGLFIRPDQMSEFLSFLDSREGVEQLIARIEELSAHEQGKELSP